MDQKLFLEKLSQYGRWRLDQDGNVELIQVRHKPVDCSHCGRECYFGKLVESKFYNTLGLGHWRHRCHECDLCYNPYTQQFDVTKGRQGHVWSRYIRLTQDQLDLEAIKRLGCFHRD